jgi:hypothetical protein
MIDLFNRNALAVERETNKFLLDCITALEAKLATATCESRPTEPPASSTNTQRLQPFRTRKSWREIKASREVELNSTARRIRRMTLDLNAIAKGPPKEK